MKDHAQNKLRPRKILGVLLKYGLPLVISIGLCYYLFSRMDFGEMLDEIQNDCDFGYIIVSMVIGTLTFVIRGARWRIQLRASNVNPPLYAMAFSIAGTYAVNIVFPRLGEIWRTEYIARRHKVPFATVFGSMMADRCADTLTVLLMLIATFFMAREALYGLLERNTDLYAVVQSVFSSPLTYLAGALVILIIWLLMRKPRKGFIGKIQNTVKSLVSGFVSIFVMKGKGRWLLLTLLLWGSYFAQMYLSFYAFGYTRGILAEHGIAIVLVCFSLSSLAMAIPSNGGIGPYQLAIILGLQCFLAGEIDELRAAAFANLVLGAQTLVTVVCGLITFCCIPLDNRRLKSVSQ